MYKKLIERVILNINLIKEFTSCKEEFNFKLKEYNHKNEYVVFLENDERILFKESFIINKDSKVEIDGIELCYEKLLKSICIYGLLGNNTFMKESKLLNKTYGDN